MPLYATILCCETLFEGTPLEAILLLRGSQFEDMLSEDMFWWPETLTLCRWKPPNCGMKPVWRYAIRSTVVLWNAIGRYAIWGHLIVTWNPVWSCGIANVLLSLTWWWKICLWRPSCSVVTRSDNLFRNAQTTVAGKWFKRTDDLNGGSHW
jgi:hypothetical protein